MPGADIVSLEARIESLSDDGRGIVECDGKSYLIRYVIPGERVRFSPNGKRRGQQEGRVEEVIESSPMRTTPRCAHFGVCGGCSVQHILSSGQVEIKQQRLIRQLASVNVTPESVALPITGPQWGYRRKARLGAKWVAKKRAALVGFRENYGNHIAVLSHCEVLHPSIGGRLLALRSLIGSLAAKTSIAQIEVAVGTQSAALVFRHTGPLGEEDKHRLIEFSKAYDFSVFVQSGGPGTVLALWPPAPPRLTYTLPDFDLQFEFEPLEFTQVNPQTNERLVSRVVEWLKPVVSDRVLDLFCGLGNFSLPLARHGAEVVGLEGSDELVARARSNARHNGITNAQFYAVDLNNDTASEFWLSQHWDKLLLDPPRSGAATIVDILSPRQHRHIVYVSCNPISLSRDADVLVNRLGYRLEKTGIVDMFPHTNHVESVSLFVGASKGR